MRRTGLLLVGLLLIGCSRPAPPVAKTPLDPEPLRAAVTAAIQGMYGPDDLKLTNKANALLSEATKGDPDWAEAWDEQARWELALQGDLRGGYSATQAVERALALDPDLVSARYHRALVSLLDRNYTEALARLDPLVDKEPRNAGIHVARGLALIGLERGAEGAQACTRAVELDPKGGGALACVNTLGIGFPVLPEAEFSLGFYEWRAIDYRYRGQTAQGPAEVTRISPPEYCRYTYPDGFSTTTVCQGDAMAYDWTFRAPFAGRSLKGIGVGSRGEQVTAAWGAAKVVDDTACYGGASATLCLHFAGETVDRIVVQPVNLKSLVRALARNGY